MAKLFGCIFDNIGLHLKNVYNSGELDECISQEKIYTFVGAIN